MYYFSDNSIYEIEQIINNIKYLFPLSVKRKLKKFIKEISLNKCCELSLYNDIISLLQKDTKNNKSENELKLSKTISTKVNEKEEAKAIKQLEYLTMMLISRAFITLSPKNDEKKIMIQEIKK